MTQRCGIVWIEPDPSGAPPQMVQEERNVTAAEAIEQLLAEPTVDITVAGAAYGVKSSRAYELADEGIIPTIKRGERRRVVPSAAMLRILGIKPELQATA